MGFIRAVRWLSRPNPREIPQLPGALNSTTPGTSFSHSCPAPSTPPSPAPLFPTAARRVSSRVPSRLSRARSHVRLACVPCFTELGNELLADKLWQMLEASYPQAIGDVNPHNEEITKLFGDQGGF